MKSMTLPSLLISLLSLCLVVCLLSRPVVASQTRWCGQITDMQLDSGSSALQLSLGLSGFHSKALDASSSVDRLHYHVAVNSSDSPLASIFENHNSRCVHSSERPTILSHSPDIASWSRVASAPSSQSVSVASHSLPLLSKLRNSGNVYLIVKIEDESQNVMFLRSPLSRLLITSNPTSIDSCSSEAYCRLLEIGVGGILDELYGPIPYSQRIFNFVPGEPLVVTGDDGYSAIDKAGIAIGTIVGATILFALLIALICGRGDSGAFGGMSSGGIVAVEPSGVRTKLATDDQKTNVVRAYPSTYLNLDHRIERVEDDTPAGHTGRTDLSGVLNTKTPSGRDFTQQL